MVAPWRLPGVKFWETFGDFAFTMKARDEVLRIKAAALSALVGVPAAAGVETAAPAHGTAIAATPGG